MKKIGLFFGSFNPIHIGHLAIAEFMVEQTDLNQLWFVVSPQNPLKEKKSLLADHHRWAMVNIAIEDDMRFRATNIEFKMPHPSYTIDTLTRLSEKHPDYRFILISGTDIFNSLHKWKNYQEILKQYSFYVYARPNYQMENFADHPKIKIFDAPPMGISSSYIRKSIKEKNEVRYLLPPKLNEYIKEMHFYEKN